MRRIVTALALAALTGPAAHAQWGGFSTASGRGVEAYGMGNWAAGRGQRNLMNSEARATNVNTNMQLNEYMYESLQQMNKAQMAAQKQENQDYTDALNQTQDRLRNHPTPEDVYKGDALNIALGELSDPRYYAHVAAEASQMKIPGGVIKILPFNSASAAVTFGLKQITHAKPAADSPLSGPQFADLVAEYQKLGAELDKQAKTDGQVDDDTLTKFEAVIQKAADRLQGMKGVPDAKKAQVEMRLKTLLGMAAMLDSPSLDVYLAELKGNEQVGLDRLLAFMRSFNLRFGVATTPGQKQAYDTLYPMLVELRDKLFGNGTGTLPSDVPEPQPDDQRPMKFFGQMQMVSPGQGGRPAPAPPAPGGR
jgi:hypothetical protein